MKQAYLDCSSGISGDMFLAVLIDAGVPVDRLFGELKKLPLGFYEFKRTRAMRGGLVGTRVDIRVPGEQPHRHLADIQALIEKASLPEKAAARALEDFQPPRRGGRKTSQCSSRRSSLPRGRRGGRRARHRGHVCWPGIAGDF